MKIIIYDPLYSKVGHYFRYNKFIIQLLAKTDVVQNIEVICTNKELLTLENLSEKIKINYIENSIDSMQIKAMEAKGFKKLQLAIKSYNSYKNIVNLINNSDSDLAFFPSQGLSSFWLCARKIKIKYAISLISIKWIYERNSIRLPLHALYKSFIKNSSLNIFIEHYYKNITIQHVQTHNIVMPDRTLAKKSATKNKYNKEILQLVTLGTISRIKSPLNFLKEWQKLPQQVVSQFFYKIHGKVMDATLLDEIVDLVGISSHVEFVNDYISESSFSEILDQADFAVIPYSKDYTKYATSGVMWDCFEKQKPIICPNVEPFRYYINKFKIGFLYNEGKLHETLLQVQNQKDSFFASLEGNYHKLQDINSEKNFIEILQNALQKSIIN